MRTNLRVEREVLDVAVLSEVPNETVFLVHDGRSHVVEVDGVPGRVVDVLQGVLDADVWTPDGLPVDFRRILRRE